MDGLSKRADKIGTDLEISDKRWADDDYLKFAN